MNSTSSDQFICHQLYTTFTIYIYTLETLSFFFQPTNFYSVYHNLLHQGYQCLFNSIIKKDYHQYLSSTPLPPTPHHTRIVPPVFSINVSIRVLSVFLKQDKTPRIVPLFTPIKIPPGVPGKKNQDIEGNQIKHICTLRYD